MQRFAFCNTRLLTQSCPTLCDPWTVAHQAPLSMEFSKQEYWSESPFLPPRNLTKPTFLVSPAVAGGFFTTEPPVKPLLQYTCSLFLSV